MDTKTMATDIKAMATDIKATEVMMGTKNTDIKTLRKLEQCPLNLDN